MRQEREKGSTGAAASVERGREVTHDELFEALERLYKASCEWVASPELSNAQWEAGETIKAARGQTTRQKHG